MRYRMQQWTDWRGIAPRLSLNVLVLALGVPAVVMAAKTRAEPEVYYACYVPGSGTIYRIKAPGLPDACTGSKHVEFSWSSQPEPGGLAGVEIVRMNALIPPGLQTTVNAVCPPGKVVTGGGFVHGSAHSMHVIHSYPAAADTWRVSLINDNTVDLSAAAFAVCANAGS